MFDQKMERPREAPYQHLKNKLRLPPEAATVAFRALTNNYEFFKMLLADPTFNSQECMKLLAKRTQMVKQEIALFGLTIQLGYHIDAWSPFNESHLRELSRFANAVNKDLESLEQGTIIDFNPETVIQCKRLARDKMTVLRSPEFEKTIPNAYEVMNVMEFMTVLEQITICYDQILAYLTGDKKEPTREPPKSLRF